MNSLIVIGSGCLVCLMPLALYLLFLAYLNQRDRPTMISGSWDFASVLLGLSGFLLIGGPLFLSALDSRLRASLFGGGSFAELRVVWDANHRIWGRIAAAYIVLAAFGVTWSIRSRRNVTAIYNLDQAAVEESFIAAIESLGLAWRRVLGGYEIGRRKVRAVASEVNSLSATPVPAIEGASSFVRIEFYSWTNHACLCWVDYDPEIRLEVEGKLAQAFKSTESPANSAGGWFMTAAVSLFFSMLLWMGFLIYQLFFVKGAP